MLKVKDRNEVRVKITIYKESSQVNTTVLYIQTVVEWIFDDSFMNVNKQRNVSDEIKKIYESSALTVEFAENLKIYHGGKRIVLQVSYTGQIALTD